jgi:hypothetical protein
VTAAQLQSLGVEPDEIVVWRTEQLERAGYPSGSAVVVASHLEVDLHTAVDLVRDGCAVETALRILL